MYCFECFCRRAICTKERNVLVDGWNRTHTHTHITLSIKFHTYDVGDTRTQEVFSACISVLIFMLVLHVDMISD